MISGKAEPVDVIRCRDCANFDDGRCNHFLIGYWDSVEHVDVLYRFKVEPDGYCAWANRRNGCQS